MEQLRLSSGQRHDFLDYAKGLGMFFVIWGHSLAYASSENAKSIYNLLYQFHMPLFFIISGIGIYLSLQKRREIDLRERFLKNAKRLMLPYIFWNAVYSFLLLIHAYIKHENILNCFLRCGYSALTGRFAPLWFLYTLFMVETAFYILYKVLSRHKKSDLIKWAVLFLFAISCILDRVYKHFGLASKGSLITYPIVMLFRFFPALLFLIVGFLGVGFVYGHNNIGLGKRKTASIALLFTSLFFIFTILCKNPTNDIHVFRFTKSFSQYFVSGILGSGAVLSVSLLIPKGVRFLSALGRESLHLMVMHYSPIPFNKIISVLTIRFFPNTVCFVSSIILTAVCWIVTVYLFEPSCALLKKLFKKRYAVLE